MTDKTNIYLMVFRSVERGSVCSPCGRASSSQVMPSDWPYDDGDDPSFRRSRQLRTNLTWGICRQQVRNRIKPTDIIVFFSVRVKKDGPPFDYRLCAIATVEEKVKQIAVWQKKRLNRFRSFSNLLIRPKGKTGWEHYEPVKEVQHGDWLWKIAEQNGLKKTKFERIESKNVLSKGSTIGGRPVSIAPNYVIFSSNQDETYILKKPLLIARCRENGQPERWIGSREVDLIQQQTLGVAGKHGSNRVSLRSTNTQHSHPTIRWKATALEAIKWREKIFDILKKH